LSIQLTLTKSLSSSGSSPGDNGNNGAGGVTPKTLPRKKQRTMAAIKTPFASSSARLRVPALIKIINGSLIDTVSPVSGALVAADVHPNLFLKSVNAKAVNEPEEEGKRGENDHSPTEDKKDCTKLDEKESAVATVKPNHMTAHKVRRCIYNQEKKSIKEGNDGRNTYTPTCSHLSAAISNLAGLLKKPQERTPHAPPNK
jgi:hypothetical protein